jgi:two-component system, cell cycle sensor histidine kinase and response regulator CckA
LPSDLELLPQEIAKLKAENGELKKALHQSEDAFRKIFHASSNMMAIHTLKERRFIDVNEAAASLGGFKREELIGHTMEERGLVEDPNFEDQVGRKLREEGKAHNVETKLRTKAGEWHTILASVDPIIYNNEPCMLAVSVDITEREDRAEALRRSEEALKESKEYLNQIINCLGDPIFVKDGEHRIMLANDAMCAFRAMSREELVGRIDLPGPMPKQFWEQENDVLRTGREIISEDELPDSQGVTHTFMAKKTPLDHKSGHRQVVGVLRDITEYKRLEAQFLQAQKMEAVGVLAGGVAHDFNNLLNVINGYAELLLADLNPNDPIRKEIEQIQEAGQRATTLTSQLLAFGRKQIMQLEIFDLNQIITDMSAMLGRMIREDIEIVSIIPQEPMRINADPGKIQQVIMNLVVNARDAMPDGGKLTIETATVQFDDSYVKEHPMTKQGPYVMLAISDNGIGMDSATQARIFEPFFTTKAKGKGTGLGMSTVYGIVKQSDGFIWVYSEPGKGTTIKIYLPQEGSSVSASLPETQLNPVLHGSETILVVEDEDAVRALACRILGAHGYKVLEAADGMQAYRMVQENAHPIHLIITDVVMPGIGGKMLLSRIEDILPGVKSMYISGYTDNAIVHHGILDSGVAFLQKPFTVDGLLRKVREVLDP